MLQNDSKHEHYVKFDENCLALGTADIPTKVSQRTNNLTATDTQCGSDW